MSRPFLAWLGGIVGTVLCCEMMFQALPVSTSTETGYYIDPVILSYPPHQTWVTSTGWDLRNVQRHKANNAGFLSKHDFERNPNAVALIGDSFVESSMLPPEDRPGPQLERALGGRPVYAFGCPGSSLLDYAERIRLVTEKYSIRDVVILMERFDLRQSLCGSGSIHGPCLDHQTLQLRTETREQPGLAKRMLRHSAFAQYLFSQLKLNPERLWQQAIVQSRPAVLSQQAIVATTNTVPSMEVLDRVASTFFDRIRGRISGNLVIVIDSDRTALYRKQPIVDPARTRFIASARAEGAKVIDTELIFGAQLQHSALKLDVGPYDGHLNRLGIAIAMGAAAIQLH
jgi:hypothetical protein